MFEGPIGRLRADDVLQLVAHLPEGARVTFETEDRVSGAPWRVELDVEAGRLIALGAGAGLRLGDLVAQRGFATRADVEAVVAAARGSRVGLALVEADVIDPAELDDLVWERHARVIWSLLAWDRGSFRAISRADLPPRAHAVDPPIALEAVLLDGLQRAESVLAR